MEEKNYENKKRKVLQDISQVMNEESKHAKISEKHQPGPLTIFSIAEKENQAEVKFVKSQFFLSLLEVTQEISTKFPLMNTRMFMEITEMLSLRRCSTSAAYAAKLFCLIQMKYHTTLKATIQLPIKVIMLST